MSDGYENEEFERISDNGAQNNELDDQGDASGDSHKMRFSIDIHSIKEHNFKGLLFAKYGALPSLGIKSFMSRPATPVTTTNVETKFGPSSFTSYEFTCTKGRLYPMLNEAKLEVEIWHQDRLKNDLLIGVSTVELQKVLRSPDIQTPQSFVRTYDAYVPLDEVNESRERIKRVALLRVIVYLEDLGPVAYLRQHEREVKSKYKSELDEIATIPAAINLRDMPGTNGNEVEKANFLNELGNIEYKIIWELENWKKAEEAKFRYQLKSKEVDFLKKLNDEWKKKEGEREKIFKRSEAQIAQVESKLKQKTLDLQKREQRLILLEEELKQKINETSRQLSSKDEEINVVRKKHKDDRIQLEKEKNILTAKNEDLQHKLSKLQDEYLEFRKEQETSPVNLIKNELSVKDGQIIQLRNEVDNANKIKEQYIAYYDKLKQEILRLQKENRTIKEEAQRQNSAEIEQLKFKLSTMALMDNKENFASLKNEFQDLRNTQFSESEGLKSSGKNPFKGNYLEASAAKPFGGQTSLKAARGRAAQERMMKTSGQSSSEYERLVREREDLMALGGYGEDDPLIQELNDQIARLEA